MSIGTISKGELPSREQRGPPARDNKV
jgi:hypothetical protein